MSRINSYQSPNEIVRNNYRTADVFAFYKINYDYGVTISLREICNTLGLNEELIIVELEMATIVLPSISMNNANKWSLDFLVDYTINIHHLYLRQNLPLVATFLTRFRDKHPDRFQHIDQLIENMQTLTTLIHAHMEEEENIIFPYVKQIYNAKLHNQAYAGLLVRTLKKPVDNLSRTQQLGLKMKLAECRKITDNFSVPLDSCLHHHVTFAKLKDLDENLAQHLYLENEVIFPRAVALERDLLSRG